MARSLRGIMNVGKCSCDGFKNSNGNGYYISCRTSFSYGDILSSRLFHLFYILFADAQRRSGERERERKTRERERDGGGRAPRETKR
jgi:hypothetical protein